MAIILVVDDNPGDRHLASLELKKIADTELLEASNGVEALDMIKQGAPDLVLTDLMMPKMDGLELVRRIALDHKRIPVILTTSCGSEEIAVRALNAGAASYVSKSTLKANLVETVRHVLDLARADRQRDRLLTYMTNRQITFELENDPSLIPPLVGYLIDNLEQRGDWDQMDRTRVGIALQEALDNALYHGNLELQSSLREQDTSEYYRLADKRRQLEMYSNRRIYFTVKESETEMEYIIRDEGHGFDPADVPDPTEPENMERVSGRGLLLIGTFMDRIQHNETGNEITLVKKSPKTSDANQETPVHGG